ncbi:DUF6116 family protein [Rehaibacterium terrae]|uniref:Putative membrane protein YccC n=1 Tax=Rehaibacterium terrae TaxID=1341696 RepID=A0A7W7Y1A8_9GAMM|nr:putative membrane protein YccC [Rehaibacterium terrae]
MPNPLLVPLLRFARRLRFPTLFFVTATLFVVNLFIPDPIPLIDELLLGLATLLLGSLRRRKRPPGDATDR